MKEQLDTHRPSHGRRYDDVGRWEDSLGDFWSEQPASVRKKARWKKNLTLDAYMSAFGRGVKAAKVDDVEIAIKILHPPASHPPDTLYLGGSRSHRVLLGSHQSHHREDAALIGCWDSPESGFGD